MAKKKKGDKREDSAATVRQPDIAIPIGGAPDITIEVKLSPSALKGSRLTISQSKAEHYPPGNRDKEDGRAKVQDEKTDDGNVDGGKREAEHTEGKKVEGAKAEEKKTQHNAEHKKLQAEKPEVEKEVIKTPEVKSPQD
jgi:hypothetical protein